MNAMDDVNDSDVDADAVACDDLCCRNETLFAVHGWGECRATMMVFAPHGIFPTEIKDGKLNWYHNVFEFNKEYLRKWRRFIRHLHRHCQRELSVGM